MPDLEWREGQVPVSTRFDDTYYSMDDGRAETLHTFIKGNGLPERWPYMDECTIAELGFGTGLNFLETIRQWEKSAKSNASFTFISFERFPLNTTELAKALDPWPDLHDLTDRLLGLWSPDFEILNEQFKPGIRLLVFMDDANVRLPQLTFQADAWYLDGFSPSKNPELWNPLLMRQVAAHTKPGGSFATYTAAGHVRRNLTEAGFEIEKVSGFGRKRHMSRGVLTQNVS